MTLNCLVCGTEFSGKPGRRYCSRKCTHVGMRETLRGKREERRRQLLDALVNRPTAECWPWTGKIDQTGYGRWMGEWAHRAVYEAMVGPIPHGHHIDHLCRNPPCVNPAHMEPVAPAENARRGRQSKMTPALVAECRRRVAAGETVNAVARAVGVDRGNMSRIVRGLAWTNVPGALATIPTGPWTERSRAAARRAESLRCPHCGGTGRTNGVSARKESN